jgi:hypothetical protein
MNQRRLWPWRYAGTVRRGYTILDAKARMIRNDFAQALS